MAIPNSPAETKGIPDPRPDASPDPAALEELIRYHIRYSLAKDLSDVSVDDLFHAVSLAVKDLAVGQMLHTARRYVDDDVKRVYYLSMEFLPGRTLGNNLLNLGIYEVCRQALLALGGDLDAILNEEPDPALGNGGLGRLAACLLDSMATLGIPGFGYGINYQFGLFRQAIENGEQVEKPDRWLADSVYWQISRHDKVIEVPFLGRMIDSRDIRGHYRAVWSDTQIIKGVPHDMPIVGFGGKTVNFLRLYSARTTREFDMQLFNQGDYLRAMEGKVMSETISRVLYPSDAPESGRRLRLIQEYFFVACALRDILRRYLRTHVDLSVLEMKVAVQMNDTHPAIAVAELMRLLVDDHGLPWDDAWRKTVAILGYTNHTLMSEALERWSVPLFEQLLPRHLQIIYEINTRFLSDVSRRWPGDMDRLRRMSIIEESDPKQVRMAHLAIVGSHSVNGVAALHSDLLKRRMASDFNELWPERFNNKTNGVTPRRWIALANRNLSQLLDQKVGPEWVTQLDRLKGLEGLVRDSGFQESFRQVKRSAKSRLCQVLRDRMGVYLSPDFFFDIQAKRIHLYKRQLLNVLRILHAYLRLVEDRITPPVPQVFLFAGKAAPGYEAAKQVIRLIHAVGQSINQDPRAHNWMKVIFVPDYRVTVAEWLVPAADLSEQISTAGTEASGTGNMKFAMNGALTIGTLDGANIEIRQAVGPENIFIFGLTTDQVQDLRNRHAYDPAGILSRKPKLQRIIDSLRSTRFCPDNPGLFDELLGFLLDPNDPFLHLADLQSYIDVHDQATALYAQPEAWTTKAILNVARMGPFSSDRTVHEYARDIWGVKPS